MKIAVMKKTCQLGGRSADMGRKTAATIKNKNKKMCFYSSRGAGTVKTPERDRLERAERPVEWFARSTRPIGIAVMRLESGRKNRIFCGLFRSLY